MNKKLTLGKVCLTYALCGVITLQPVFANVVIDGNSGNTSKTAAINGVEVINIATPNGQGLSHNKYQRFDVDPSGLILNNSMEALSRSQLGGILQGNPHLNGKAANVILNEVTGANRSQLEGYTEVFGQQANVILANPYGITCDGCGFINTPRVTLSTGTPEIQNGLVSGFDVAKGSVTIEGLGLDATRQTYFDIISRTAEINANIHANELSIVTGVNEVEYQTNKASEKSSGSATIKPKLAIDSSSLGGMYAGRISLVATEDGVGVNVGNLVANSGDIVLTADGTLQIKEVVGEHSIHVSSSENTKFNGKVVAGRELVTSGRTIEAEKAKLVAGDMIKIKAKENIQLKNSQVVAGLNRDKSTNSGSSMTFSSEKLDTKNSAITSHGLLTSNTETANIDRDSQIASQDITFNSIQSIANDGEIASVDTLVLNGNKLSIQGEGNIKADKMSLVTDDLTIDSNLKSHSLTATSKGVLKLNSNANVESKNNTVLKSKSVINVGHIVSNDTVDIIADHLQHDGYTEAENVTIKVTNVDQTGSLTANNILSISEANSITLAGSNIGRASFDITSKEIEVVGALLGDKGQVTAEGTMKVNSSSSIATDNTLILISKELDNSGRISSGKDITVQTETLSNSHRISAIESASINASDRFKNFSSSDTQSGVHANSLSVIAPSIVNEGQLSAKQSLKLQGSSLTNGGALLSAKDLTIDQSGHIDNTGFMYASQNALLFSNSLLNKSDILAGESLLFAKNQARDRSQYVTNSSGNIESKGNLEIYTAELTNKRTNLDYDQGTSIDRRSYFSRLFDSRGTSYAPSFLELFHQRENSRGNNNQTWTTYHVSSGGSFSVEVFRERQILKNETAPATIVSRNNLSADVNTLVNDASQIAGKTVSILANSLSNIGYKSSDFSIFYDYKISNPGSYRSKYFLFEREAERTVDHGSSKQLNASITATNNLSINLPTNDPNVRGNAAAVNTTVGEGTILAIDHRANKYGKKGIVEFPKFVFPTSPNGLFITSPHPRGKYLIETNPALTNMEEFLGSDYFLSKVGFNPEKNVKFLGDAFYDNRLISQAIFEQTGKQFLNREVGSQLEQMQQLLDSAGEQKQALDLSVGVALTPEQISQLTSDMVWYEEVEVNGQKVLAPKLYLARATLNHVGSGALIAAENVEINGGSLENSGVLSANKSLDINSGDSITNIGGKIASNGKVYLAAKNDVTNISGDILGQDIEIRSTDGSFINETKVTKTSASLGNNSGTFTDVGKTARVTSNGELLIDVGKNVENSAATISSTGNASIKAGENIVVDSKENTQSYDVRFRRGRVSESNTTQLASSITSGGNLELESGNSLTISASEANATGNFSLKAQNDITIKTALNKQSDHRSNAYRTDINRSTQHQGSSLSGSSVSMNSGGKVTVSGSSVSALDALDISAKGDVDILAVNDSHYHYDKTVTKKSFGRSKTTINETYREAVKGSSISAGDSISIKAQNLDSVVTVGGDSDINIIGSALNADNEVTLSADGDVKLAAQTYKTFERHETIEKGFGGLSKRNKGTLEDATLLNSSYLINSGNTSINAGKDIGVIASEVTSGGEVNLNAVEDVLIAAGDVLKKSQQWDEKMSFLSGGNLFEMEKKRQGEETSTAQSSSIQSGGSLTVNGGSVKVVGSELNADNNVSLTADTGDVEILAAKEMTKKFESEEKLAISLGHGFEGVSLEDGRLKVSLGDAKYDKVKQQSEALNHKGSLVNADNNLLIDAESSIMVEGSKLASDADQNNHGDLSLRANNDITIKEAVDTFSEQREEIHGTAEASVVVQHQAVEVTKAAKALKDSTDNLKQAKKDYKQYKKNLDSLQTTLATLEQEYKAKKPGVIYEDIEELQDLVSEVKSDEAWYVAGVALATEDVVSKTTNLYQQTAALATSASSCAYCLGFNAGIQLDIDASKTSTSTQGTTSIASNLSGQNVLIKAGNAEGSQANIQGSRLAAKDKLELSADEVNITASKNTEQNKTDNKSGSVSASMTVFGATTGINLNASYDRNQSTSSSITHNNSQLNADNITITSTQDTNIKGATVAANESLTVDVGGDLNVASVQDRHSSSHKGMGISGGISLTGGQTAGKNEKQPQGTLKNMDGAGDLAGANGGINASNGRTRTKQTVLTSLTSGGSADITVANNTDVKGALISTTDENGQDSGKLNLTTNSLTYADLSNTNYSQNKSVGISAGYSFKAEEQKLQGQNDGSTSKDNNDPTKDDSKFNSSSYQYTNTSGYSKSKTLATIGQGQLTIADSENSDDTSRLNRDTEQTEKDLFTVDRKQGDFDVTVDHRLLTEDGINQIAEDVERTGMIGETVVETASKDSVGVISDHEEGVTGFFARLGEKNQYFDATKAFLTDEASSEHANTLNDPNATPEQKRSAYQSLVNHIATEFGIDSSQVKLADIGQKGLFADGVAYIDDSEHYRLEDAVNTVGNESSHMVDAANAPDNQGENYVANREEYSNLVGDDVEGYLSFNFSNLGKGGFGGWNTQNGTKGSKTIEQNTQEFSLLRHDVPKWNRLPDNQEVAIINKLAGDDSTKQRELLAAGCALIHCAKEFAVGSDEHSYYSQLEKEGADNQAAQQVLLNYSETTIGTGTYHSSYNESALEGKFVYTRDDHTSDSELLAENATNRIIADGTGMSVAMVELLTNVVASSGGDFKRAMKAASRVGKNKGQNTTDDYSGQQTATLGEGSALKSKTNDSGTYVKIDESNHNGVSSGQDPNNLGQAPPNSDAQLKITRESVKADLDKLPDGQSDNHYVRQNTDGSYTTVRKDTSKSEKVNVTDEGNLYSPVNIKGGSKDLSSNEKGKQGVEISKQEALDRGEIILGEEISIKLENSKVTKADILVEKPSGGLKVIECKNGPCAKLTPNQKQAQTELPAKGGEFIGGNAKNSELPTGENTGSIEYQVDWHNKDGFE